MARPKVSHLCFEFWAHGQELIIDLVLLCMAFLLIPLYQAVGQNPCMPVSPQLPLKNGPNMRGGVRRKRVSGFHPPFATTCVDLARGLTRSSARPSPAPETTGCKRTRGVRPRPRNLFGDAMGLVGGGWWLLLSFTMVWWFSLVGVGASTVPPRL